METRLPPPQGAPPTYAFVTRVYRRSLRPVVICIALFTAIWTLFWAIGAFRVTARARQDVAPRFGTFTIVLGALYSASCAIEVVGIFAAVAQRIALIRLYAYGSVATYLMIVGAGILRTVIHFKYKNQLINECTTLSQGQTVRYIYGYWGPRTSAPLTSAEAAAWCRSAWNRDSWSEIISVIFELVLGALFVSISFAYLRQVLDPTSPANLSRRVPAGRLNLNDYPAHYNPPYNSDADVPSLPYDAPAYAPPAGPPPDDGKPPGYGFGGPDYDDHGRFKGDKDEDDDRDRKVDPFSDFDAPSRRGEDRA